MADKSTLKERQVRIGKVHPSKIYDYIKKIEVDGLPRIRAYAEAIDEKIYDLPPAAAHRKLDRVREDYPEYEEIKEMVLAEESNWAIRKSHTAQDKALSLLVNSINKANEMLENPDCSSKDLMAATSVLKTIMPAITAVNDKANTPQASTDRKARASKYIN